MLKNLLTLILFCSFSWSLMGQCPAGSVILETQADVDDFVANYPNCTDFTATIFSIGPFAGSSDITDISGLVLETLANDLGIRNNPTLTSLAGLDNITTGNNVFITNNASLTSLAGLSSLVTINQLNIVDNGMLTDLNGLSNLSSIPGSLTITGNTMLSDCAIAAVCDEVENSSPTISGNATGCASEMEIEDACNPVLPCPVGDVFLFSQEQLDSFFILYPTCTTIDGDLVIGDEFGASDITDLSALSGITTVNGGCYFYNTQLTNFAGVGNVSTLNGECVIVGNNLITNLNGLGAPPGFTITNLIITDNALLTEITAFSMLTTISGDLRIDGNGSLTSFDGLQSLTTIGGGCFYNDNTSLVSIELSSLTSVGGALQIVGNTSLSNCAIASVCEAVSGGGMVMISGNGPGCTSLAEVEAACGGDVCPMGDLVLATQADVDDFVANYPDCTEVDGNLVIGIDGGSSDITDISGLSSLTTIYGGCYFYNTQLTSFNGVGSITTLSGECVIVGNNLITNLNGLGAPPGFAITNLIITDNALLTEITAFSMLTTISGYLEISRNGSLTSFSGLENLMTIGGGCFYYDNTSLVSIELTSLTSVGGALEIVGNTSLSNCAIASVCDAIDGGMSIIISGNGPGCESIEEIAAECGFGGPDCLEGDVILSNQNEVDFYVANFPNCTTINGDLHIGASGNMMNDITDITGLSTITSITGNLIITSTSLTTLTGLNSITSVGGNCLIRANANLVSIQALSSITSVNGFLRIEQNNSLTTLMGAGNSNATGLTLLVIRNNPLLTTCNIENVCNYLAVPSNLATITNNAIGCNNRTQVEMACETVVPDGDCPENIEFMTQAQVDDFLVQYPNCTEITGFLKVGCGLIPTDITDLTPLSNLIVVGGQLAVFLNPDLNSMVGLDNIVAVGGNLGLFSNNLFTDLSGLESLTNLAGDLNIYGHQGLIDLSGLDALTSIGGKVVIEANSTITDLTGLDNISSVGGFLGIANNSSLTSLGGLESMTSVGFLTIRDNDALSSLTGLENISAGNISRLYIVGNSILTDCAIDNVCAFLAVPGSLATIGGNGGGCSDRDEVEAACNEGGIVDDLTNHILVSDETTSEALAQQLEIASLSSENQTQEEATPAISSENLSLNTGFNEDIKLYPNPTSGLLQVRNVVAQSVIVFNSQGQRVAQFDNPGTELDMSALSAGFYYLNFLTADGIITKRIVKVD